MTAAAGCLGTALARTLTGRGWRVLGLTKTFEGAERLRRGPVRRPALDRLEGYVVAGLPIVTAFPGLLYGRSSWFRARVAVPIMNGRCALQPSGRVPWVSPIHIEDCVGALVHLARRGKPGGRYFLVNSAPRNRLRVPVPHARSGSPASPGSAR